MSHIPHSTPPHVDPNDIPRAIAHAHDLRSQAIWTALTRVSRAGRRIFRGWSRGTRSEARARKARC